MNNIFQIGGKVSGESFIGRKEQVKYLRKVFIENEARTGKAIVGLTRIGKSSLALNVFQDLPDHIIYIYEDLNEWSEYVELWQDICCAIKEYLEKNNKITSSLSDNLKLMEGTSIPWIKLNRTIKKIFEELSNAGIKTILVLDEFDNASVLFDEGTKHFELFRTIFSDAKYDVSAMTISRRNLHTIEGATYQSSTFHGVLDTIPFKGFDDSDMDEYFRVFEHEGIVLTEEQKEEIVYYAGRAPFLLSIIGHYVIDAAEKGEQINITKIFLSKCKAINDYYRDCVQHLTRDGDLKRVIPFVIGPNVGVTQNDRDELINLGYLREEDDKLVAISNYFENFLSANMLQVSIWDNVINLEKRIKLIIEQELANVVDHYQVGGESMVAVQRNILEHVNGITDADIYRYDNFISNNLKIFEIQSVYLDVMSLTDSFKILKDCWEDIFARYFNNDLYSNWNYKFDKCSRARNPIAHGHEEYLSELDKNEVDTYCKQIFDVLAQNHITNETKPDEKTVLEAASKYVSGNAVSEIEYSQPISSLVDSEIEFVVLKRGGTKHNNLSGVVNGEYKGVIPKNYLENVDLDMMVGTTIKCVVERINGDNYLLRYDAQPEDTIADKHETSLEYSISDLVAACISGKE
jgi:hypothetical protein